MVTRTGWDGRTWGRNQRITLEEALRVNTLNGAYNSHEESIKRSITPGKLADFVVLSEDLFTVDSEKDQGYRDRSHRGRRCNRVPGVTVRCACPPRNQQILASRGGQSVYVWFLSF
jgi:hypothetical protein